MNRVYVTELCNIFKNREVCFRTPFRNKKFFQKNVIAMPVKKTIKVLIVRDEATHHFLRDPRFQPAQPMRKSGPMPTTHI